jgi:hypothetical protein
MVGARAEGIVFNGPKSYDPENGADYVISECNFENPMNYNPLCSVVYAVRVRGVWGWGREYGVIDFVG